MNAIEISINLDPVHDGAVIIEKEMEHVKDAHGLIIATNGDYKEAGAQDVAKILKGLWDRFDVDCMGKTDFVTVFNSRKVIRHEGRKYLVGSVLVVKETGEGIELLDETELEQAKKEFVSRLAVLKIGDISCAAYEIG
ncbi:MAG: hypothetical protein J6Q02_01515 [Lachnospiraceae bacterium]|nr:hypothetical protein [Lachnospiraceae bacterium]